MSQPSSRTRIAIAVVQREDQFLVGERIAGTVLAGHTEFPGGKVRPNETPAAAAVRECSEETGLAVEVVREALVVDHRYDHGDLTLYFFLCRPLDPSHTPTPSFRWIARNELRALNFPAANELILRELCEGR